MARKKVIAGPSTTYERQMAEAVAEYKAWVASKQKVRAKQLIDYVLPVTGSDNSFDNAYRRLRQRQARAV